ncbi:uncharacterized protein LOC133369706 [Rhineura floridana]|uniref:uncharacterized protein LOC133369706 n=1 Tax=Rhineura floridana TaxID=261503 RepID=UPI002AC8037F|nr:uncharacterized protein LOC133369706 [Rhineura floridana]
MIMIFVLLFPFLREITGATFFYHYESADHLLSCLNTSANRDETRWWLGAPWSSLQVFCPMHCDQSGNPLNSTGQEDRCSSSPNCTQRNVSIAAFPHGGIFACYTLSDNMSDTRPLFNFRDNCNNFNFFIVAIINSAAEEKIKTIPVLPEESKSVKEQYNFSLSCKFELDDSIFALYWIKETNRTTCLSSVSNGDFFTTGDFSNDVNCCVDTKIKNWQVNNLTGPAERHQSHELTVFNVTTSDTGVYFCLVVAFSQKHVWKVVNNVSVKVEKRNGIVPVFTNELQISLGVIGGIALISGITLFLRWRKNSKGKPSELHQRDLTNAEMEDDCSPYAISSHNDICGNEVVYSLAMSPGVDPAPLYCLPDSKSASGMQPGENLQDIYAVVNKERTLVV